MYEYDAEVVRVGKEFVWLNIDLGLNIWVAKDIKLEGEVKRNDKIRVQILKYKDYYGGYVVTNYGQEGFYTNGYNPTSSIRNRSKQL